jgi:soluble lytic murein transglycosylase
MIPSYWAKSIQVRWPRRAGRRVAALFAAMPLLAATPAAPSRKAPASAHGAETLAAIARAYRESPSPARRTLVELYAKAHTKDPAGTLARLVLGIVAYEQRDYAAALEELRGLATKLPRIGDYAAYYQGAAEVEANDLVNAAQDLLPVHRSGAPSPFAGRAWVLEARALKLSQPAEAVRLLREHYSALPQPEGDINLADCYQAAGDVAHAADFYQRVYYERISGDPAARAAAALITLKDTMGAAYPEPLPQQRLRRAELLLEAREYPEARREYQSLARELGGLEQDRARVGIGAADFLSGDQAAAYPYLRGLELGESEADAERLFYLEEIARRLTDEDEMMAAVRQLGERYPQSPWRLKALVGASNRYLVTNRPPELAALDATVYTNFPSEPPAAQAHWRMAFRAYLENRGEAPTFLREHLTRYPAHPTAAAALYFLGRGAEREGDFAAAAAYYAHVAKAMSNTYYAMLARQRLAEAPELRAPGMSSGTAEFLAALGLPQANAVPGQATAATTARIERSRLLRSAGLPDLADTELRFGARTDSQPALLAIEMASAADAPYQSLRAMKSLNSDYLNLPMASAPEKFWQLLFPLPYRTELVGSARAVDLDPYLVAGLIRQESEFNPQALSRANAYGLTQVRPATGRQFAARAGVAAFTNRVLFQPAANLKIGATILRSMLDKNNGNLEQTLASYNAGPVRAAEWLTWNTYREPAEFVETIPYNETREYVQAVLRNADIYRRLYKAAP